MTNGRPFGIPARRWLALSALLCLTSGVAAAQTAYGSINGTVADASESVIPGAAVTLTSVDTQAQTEAETNANGYYVFINVVPGTYSMTVAAEGFSRAVESEFVLNVNQTRTHDFALTVGAVTETIEVVAEAALLQQSTSELGTAITEEAVQDLPLNGRNYSQLLTLTPGATPVSTAQGNAGGTSFNAPVALPGSSFALPSINGAWNRSNMNLLDGVINHWFYGQSWAVLPIVDAVQEFKVQSHNDKAEYGGVLGGVINLVSKSGTNDFHGSVWEFVRNDAFDSRNPFLDARNEGPTPFRQNQYGVAVGGPAIRNKTFFHFAWEGWKYRRSQQQSYFHPTDSEISGNFNGAILDQDIYDPATTRVDPANAAAFLRDPFPNRTIPQARIDPITRNYFQNYFDRPNISNPAFNVINTRPQQSDNNTIQVKADHRFGNADNLWFRYSQLNNPQTLPATVKNGRIFSNRPRNIAGGWVHLLGTNVVFDTKFGWVREALNTQADLAAGLEPLQADGWIGIDDFGAPGIGLQSPYGGPGVNTPRPETDWQWMFSEGVSWIKGNHNIKFGGMYVWQERDALTTQHSVPFNNAQTAAPGQPGTTGNSVASALLGLPAQYTIRNQNYNITWPTLGLYVQDEWKASSRLTVNFGLRYDTYWVGQMNRGLQAGFDWDTGDWLIGGGVLPRPCSEAGVAPCIPGSGNLADIPNGQHIRVANDPNLYEPAHDGYQPRVGIAWRLRDSTVLRAGYGVNYDSFTGVMQGFQQSIGTWPDKQFAQPAYNAVGEPLVSVGRANQLGGAPLPDPSPFGSAGWYANPRTKPAYSHQWNIEIQEQLKNNLTFSIAYVGSRTKRLEHNGAANTATSAGPGSPEEVRQRRPFPYQTTMFYGNFDGQGWYDSLQMKLNRRFSNGFQALVSYTWSKSLDTQSGWFGAENGIGGSSAVQDYYNIMGSKGPSGYNIPHFVSVAAVYELPFGPGKRFLNRGVAAQVLGGWQLNTIAQFRSGQPANLSVTGDVANIGNEVAWWNYARPNLVGDPFSGGSTEERWFNTDAFATPVLSYGNFGKNVIYTEAVENVDISLFKQVQVAERYTVELRIESFNAFNIQNLGAPNTTLGNPNFGRVAGLAGGTRPRVFQFGLKFLF